MEFLTGADGRRLDYTRRGRGMPLLLVQGMAGHHEMWGEEFQNLLAPWFDVVAYDHRGIGRGDRAEQAFSIADLADDAAAVISSLGWPEAHVFGISMGGMVAQELALRHPGRVSSLTLGCTSPGEPGGVISETSRRMVDAFATRDVEHSLRTSFEANFSRRYAATPGAFESYRILALAVKTPVPVILMQWEAAQAHSAGRRLPLIKAPTLVLHGTEDAEMPVSNAHLLAAGIKGSRLEMFPGTGHLFYWEEPERTAELLKAHVREC